MHLIAAARVCISPSEGRSPLGIPQELHISQALFTSYTHTHVYVYTHGKMLAHTPLQLMHASVRCIMYIYMHNGYMKVCGVYTKIIRQHVYLRAQNPDLAIRRAQYVCVCTLAAQKSIVKQPPPNIHVCDNKQFRLKNNFSFIFVSCDYIRANAACVPQNLQKKKIIIFSRRINFFFFLPHK